MSLESKGRNGVKSRITVSEFDVLMLRNDPAEDRGSRAWAQSSGINFGRMAMQQGVIVLNDPNGLAKAMNKSYFQLFPADVRPQAIITRDVGDIRAFVTDLAQQGVTVFLTTHYMEEADHLSNRVAILDKGHIVAMGTPAELKVQHGDGATLEDVFVNLTGHSFRQGFEE